MLFNSIAIFLTSHYRSVDIVDNLTGPSNIFDWLSGQQLMTTTPTPTPNDSINMADYKYVRNDSFGAQSPWARPCETTFYVYRPAMIRIGTFWGVAFDHTCNLPFGPQHQLQQYPSTDDNHDEQLLWITLILLIVFFILRIYRGTIKFSKRNRGCDEVPYHFFQEQN
ncbi:hypothetical protein BDC45DRAFT_531161 [Circinella umbellata]|nr:hypothetical protein BDC45DRAFT_531161 [Circinella umbellata]